MKQKTDLMSLARCALNTYREPTTRTPSLAKLEEWNERGRCRATDGCVVEPDGECPHGYPSWLMHMGMI